MRAVEQWTALEAELGDAWERATFSFEVEDPESVAGTAAVLGPLGPGRVGSELRFELRRRGSGPDKLRNLLGHLDRKRLWGDLTVVSVETPEPRDVALGASEPQGSLAASWDAELSRLPPGWRDLLCELELDSTDYLARAALLGTSLNPTRNPDAIALRFRASSGGGYGTAAVMVRRCLELMDAERITGRVRLLTVLSDTHNVATQGPVWRVAGKSV
ncbi:MAG TPA: hypothetical protein VMN35_07390 [Gaiellaceae bacterium]|nr:hypothetical protein [Gaiellaceae bacterium]